VVEKGWQRRFDDPIDAPDGTRLNTLREAVAYLAKTIPKSERNMPAVTTAAEMLTYAAEREIAWVFLARVATRKAIHRHEVRQFNPGAKDHHWGKRKLKRDEKPGMGPAPLGVLGISASQFRNKRRRAIHFDPGGVSFLVLALPEAAQRAINKGWLWKHESGT